MRSCNNSTAQLQPFHLQQGNLRGSRLAQCQGAVALFRDALQFGLQTGHFQPHIGGIHPGQHLTCFDRITRLHGRRLEATFIRCHDITPRHGLDLARTCQAVRKRQHE